MEEILSIISDARDGRFVGATQVMKLAKLFKDQVTLENMPRAQLVQLCKCVLCAFCLVLLDLFVVLWQG